MNARKIEQPEFLKTDKVVPWSWGRGNDVWAMFEAAAVGNVVRMEQLLAMEPTLIRSWYDYATPLHFAVRENQIEAACWLLNHGADAELFCSPVPASPVDLAEKHGHHKMSELLKLHLSESFGVCAAGEEVARAIRANDQPNVETLIAKHGVNVADQYGNQPLHWAALTGQIPLIDLLLAEGSDINAVRPGGARPVDLSNGDHFHRGTHPRATTEHWATVKHLLAHGADYELTTACRLGDLERVREILKKDPQQANADVPYHTWNFGQPLRNAALAGHLEVVRLLLENGADPNKPEPRLAPWGAALHDAVWSNHPEVAELLVEYKANPNQEMESCANVLYVADQVKIDRELRQMLVDTGAAEFLPDEKGEERWRIADSTAPQPCT